jgi:hypothetical protein
VNPPKPRYEWIAIGIATVIFASLSLAAAVKSTGFLEADACTHYQYARFALGEPHYLVNVWGRPFVTALHTIPATLWGVLGVRVTSLACALLIATIAWRIAKDLGYRYPALAFIFTLAQPLVFMHSFSELTELPFALLLALGFWAYCRKQWFVMALMIGLTPTARPEGFGFLVLAALALIAHRRWWWLIVLPMPLLIWTWAGWKLFGQPVYTDALAQRVPPSMHWLLWLKHEWPYAQESTYASGRLLHFVAQLPALVSPLIFPFMLVGIIVSLSPLPDLCRSLRTKLAPEDDDTHRARCQVLIAAIPLMILVGHSVLYWRGKMASNGELRYLIIVAPFWALLAATGWEWTVARLNLRLPHAIAGVAALLPLLVNLYHPVVPIRMSTEGYKAKAVAHWYRDGKMSIDYPRLLCSNPEVVFHMGVSHTDGGWVREWRKETVAKAQPGTLLIWDPVYGSHNADANRVITLDEIRAAGWIELRDVGEEFNANDYGFANEWRFFVSPTTIFGREHPRLRYERLLKAATTVRGAP